MVFPRPEVDKRLSNANVVKSLFSGTVLSPHCKKLLQHVKFCRKAHTVAGCPYRELCNMLKPSGILWFCSISQTHCLETQGSNPESLIQVRYLQMPVVIWPDWKLQNKALN